jgi:hypothetical protein
MPQDFGPCVVLVTGAATVLVAEPQYPSVFGTDAVDDLTTSRAMFITGCDPQTDVITVHLAGRVQPPERQIELGSPMV